MLYQFDVIHLRISAEHHVCFHCFVYTDFVFLLYATFNWAIGSQVCFQLFSLKHINQVCFQLFSLKHINQCGFATNKHTSKRMVKDRLNEKLLAFRSNVYQVATPTVHKYDWLLTNSLVDLQYDKSGCLGLPSSKQESDA